MVTGLDGDGADRGDEEEDGEELHFSGGGFFGLFRKN